MKPACEAFVPAGDRGRGKDPVLLGLDELEALRLSDLKGLEQGPASESMGISRQTFGRILGSARRLVADALVNGRELKLGAADGCADFSLYRCAECGQSWAGRCRIGHCPGCGAAGRQSCGDAHPGNGGDCCGRKAAGRNERKKR